jgi:S1-C subfamily serine protease
MFFITGHGCLISNFHVVKDATKVRLLTSAGLIDAKVVQTDAANDIACSRRMTPTFGSRGRSPHQICRADGA